MATPTPRIGEHLARLRHAAGLTQEALAERAGLSVTTIQQLEQGKRHSARMSTLSRLAAALGVSTSALIGDASAAVDLREPTAEPVGLVAIRRALTPITAIDGTPLASESLDSEPTLASVTADVAAANAAYHSDDLGGALACLPGAIARARALVEASDGDDVPAAHAIAARAYQVAGRTLIQYRQVDLAHVALSEALRHAHASGDLVVAADTIAHICWHLIRVGRFADAYVLAVDTADRVEPRLSKASPAQLTAWGSLLLRAVGAAVRDARHDEARDILRLADSAAAVLADRPNPNADLSGHALSFEVVHLMRVETLVVSGDYQAALTLAEQAPRSPHVTPSARHRHRLDVAWAYVQTGRYDDADRVLRDLHAKAPSWLRQQWYARQIVAEMLSHQRRRTAADTAELLAMVGAADPGQL